MALLFNETTQYITVSDNAKQTLPDADWTLGGWLKPTDNTGTTFQYFFSNGSVGGNNTLNWYIHEASASSPGAFHVRIADSNGPDNDFQSANGLASTNWILALLVRSGSTLTQYIDNASEGSVSVTSNLDAVDPSGTLNLGRRADGNSARYYGGRMAEWFKIDRAATAEERAALLNGVKPPQLFSGELGDGFYYPMDINAVDLSGNANNGTLNGTPTVAGHAPVGPYLLSGNRQNWIESAPNGETVGSSSGAATITGTGAANAEAAGDSTGAAVVTGVGKGSAETTGSSSGSATASGVGESNAEAVGSVGGAATVSGVGNSTADGQTTGSVSGVSTVAGVGASTAETVGTASGNCSVNGVALVPSTAIGGGLQSKKRKITNQEERKRGKKGEKERFEKLALEVQREREASKRQQQQVKPKKPKVKRPNKEGEGIVLRVPEGTGSELTLLTPSPNLLSENLLISSETSEFIIKALERQAEFKRGQEVDRRREAVERQRFEDEEEAIELLLMSI